MRAERIRVLNELDKRKKELCERCKPYDYRGDCDCAASIRIKELGSALLYLTNPRNPEEYKILNSIELEDMTEDYYWQFKYAGMSDRIIIEKLGVSLVVFNKWKRENNLSNKRGVGL